MSGHRRLSPESQEEARHGKSRVTESSPHGPMRARALVRNNSGMLQAQQAGRCCGSMGKDEVREVDIGILVPYCCKTNHPRV